MPNKQIQIFQKIFTVLLFLTFLVIGLFIYKDYGNSFDEGIQRRHGLISVNYIFQDSFLSPLLGDMGDFEQLQDLPNLRNYAHRHYGVVFHLFLLLGEYLLGIDPASGEVWFFRHLMTFLVFFVATICFYKLLYFRFKKWYLAILGTLFLILSPRIFANSFYNLKDLLFLSLFIIALYFAVLYIKKYTHQKFNWIYLLLASFSAAISINIRVFGLLLIPFIFLGIYYKLALVEQNLFLKEKASKLNFFSFLNRSIVKNYKQHLTRTLVFLLSTFIFTFMFWPASWHNPFWFFLESIAGGAQYGWGGNNIYMGQLVPGKETPWHYTLVWISISTPILYTILFLFGFVLTLKKIKNIFDTPSSLSLKDTPPSPLSRGGVVAQTLLKEEGDSILEAEVEYKKRFVLNNYFDFALLFSFVLVILVTIILNSTLYNGWRHFYFLYAPFLYLAVLGLDFLFKLDWLENLKFLKNQTHKNYLKWSSLAVFIFLIALQIFQTSSWMIKNHPYQFVYFNFLAGDVAYNFDRDYWKVSFKQAIEHIAKTDDSEFIVLYDPIPPVRKNATMIAKEDRARFGLTNNKDEADYILYDYWNHFGNEKEIEGFEEVYYVKVDDFKIFSVFKITNN